MGLGEVNYKLTEKLTRLQNSSSGDKQYEVQLATSIIPRELILWLKL